MRKYLRKVLFFCIGLGIINILAYSYISIPLLYERYIVPLADLEKYQNFLFADSHGEAINKQYLAQYGIYNFSYGSDSYCDMYNKLTFLYDQGIHPDTIFVSVDDHTLSPYRETTNNLNRSIFYANIYSYTQYSKHGSIAFYFSKHILPFFPIFNTSNSRLFSSHLLSKLLPDKPTTQTTTTQKKQSKQPQKTFGFTEEENRDRMKYQFPEGSKSEMLEDCLEDILYLCQQNNTTLIGIKFPLSAEYIKAIEDKSYHADALFVSQGFAVIDLKYAFIGNSELFKDPDHVSQEGAKKLAALLVEKAALCTK